MTRKQMTTNVIVVVVVAVILGTVLYFAKNAGVGDCVKETSSNGIKQVDCDGSEAEYRIVGRVDDKNQDEATLDTCSRFQGTARVYWEQSFVLCLGDVPN